MMNVIIPIDFSETSLNAAQYGARMYKGRQDVNIILYHFYEKEEDLPVAKKYLESLRSELAGFVTNTENLVESGDNFIDSLSLIAHVKRAYMIIMGLTGKSLLAQRFSGSNTLKMAEKNVCPVLIIPAGAVYVAITNILIASEMKNIEDTPVLLAVKRVLNDFKPNVHILNVNDSHYIALSTEFKEQRDKMEALLIDFKPEFYFMRLFDFHESINLFVNDKNIDMIIMGPRYHSFFERLFKTQHTKKMIYQSKVPVLAVHE